MMEHPQDLSYTAKHLWVRANEGETIGAVGITEDLIEELGEVESIDMPMLDDELDIDTYCIHLHLRTRIHHLRAPMTGRVTEINREVLDSPNLLHLAPYQNWLYKMEIDDQEEFHLLMSATQYAKYLDTL